MFGKYADIPTAPTATANWTYDVSTHDLLATTGSMVHGTIKYRSRYKKAGAGSYGSWSSYSTTVPQATNAGTYQVQWNVADGDIESGYIKNPAGTYTGTYTITVAQAPNAFVTHPTPIEGLVYTGNPQPFVNAGSVQHGSVKYTLGGTVGLDLAIPQATDIGTYTVNYVMDGGDNYESDFSQN